MKNLLKLSIVAIVFTLTMVSFTPSRTCSERLFYNVPGTGYNRGSVDEIDVTGNYIDVTWGEVKQYAGGSCDVYIRDDSGQDKLLNNGRNKVSPGKYFLHMDWSYLISADVTVKFQCD
jgi:hypothetical protein